MEARFRPTRSPVAGGLGLGDAGAPMALIRRADAPMVGGKSKVLRKLHQNTKDGPMLSLPNGWEPHWTYSEIPVSK